jgi:hypothetical protein
MIRSTPVVLAALGFVALAGCAESDAREGAAAATAFKVDPFFPGDLPNNEHALPNLGPGGTRAPARGMTGPKLGRRARTRPEPVKHELCDLVRFLPPNNSPVDGSVV